MAGEVVRGSEEIRTAAHQVARAAFEAMMIEKPDVRDKWLTLRGLNVAMFESMRDAWMHGFLTALSAMRNGKL